MSCSYVDTVHSSPQVSVFDWRPGCDWDDLGFFEPEQAKEMNVFGVTVLRMWRGERAMRDWIIGSIGELMIVFFRSG